MKNENIFVEKTAENRVFEQKMEKTEKPVKTLSRAEVQREAEKAKANADNEFFTDFLIAIKDDASFSGLLSSNLLTDGEKKEFSTLREKFLLKEGKTVDITREDMDAMRNLVARIVLLDIFENMKEVHQKGNLSVEDSKKLQEFAQFILQEKDATNTNVEPKTEKNPIQNIQPHDNQNIDLMEFYKINKFFGK